MDEIKQIVEEKPVIIEVIPEINSGIAQILQTKSLSRDNKRKKITKTEEANERDLEVILNEDDYNFYQIKKDLYLDGYPDLTDPFDLDDLHLMIMEQIFQRNLLRKKKKVPAIDIGDDYEKSVKRQNDLKKSLSMRRTDRVKDKSFKKPQINIAELSVHFNDKDKFADIKHRMLKLKEEESIFDSSDKVVE